MLEAKWYPIATMVFQSVASVIVGAECFLRLVPDIFCDSTGAAFIFPLAKLLGCYVMAYVHYPIISTDMLQAVREQRPSYNNDTRIASNVTVSHLKLVYYQVFALLYTFVGSFASLVMVNSSWTQGHIAKLWQLTPEGVQTIEGDSASSRAAKRARLLLLYPPCDVACAEETDGNGGPEAEAGRQRQRLRHIVSVGQFRPEKDHSLQLRAFKALKALGPRWCDFPKLSAICLRVFQRSLFTRCGNTSPTSLLFLHNDDVEYEHLSVANHSSTYEVYLCVCARPCVCVRVCIGRFSDVRLVLIGSARHSDDERLVEALRAEARALGVDACVDWAINAPYEDLQRHLRSASVGLHTMWNEHFGISVVDMMAAGLLVVAHRSGGPLMDIVTPLQGLPTGGPCPFCASWVDWLLCCCAFGERTRP